MDAPAERGDAASGHPASDDHGRENEVAAASVDSDGGDGSGGGAIDGANSSADGGDSSAVDVCLPPVRTLRREHVVTSMRDAAAARAAQAMGSGGNSDRITDAPPLFTLWAHLHTVGIASIGFSERGGGGLLMQHISNDNVDQREFDQPLLRRVRRVLVAKADAPVVPDPPAVLLWALIRRLDSYEPALVSLVKAMVRDHLGGGRRHIATYAFSGSMVEEVEIPRFVVCLQHGAFQDCARLRRVNAGAAVWLHTIEPDVFAGCVSLTNVTLPDSLRAIESGAFSQCGQLKTQALPHGLRNIVSGAFAKCSSLVEIAVPSTVVAIGTRAFEWCTSLKKVTLPDGLKRISEGLFRGCTSLTDVALPPAVKIIDVGAFSACSSLRTIDLPEGLWRIGDNAFYECESLEAISLPASIREVGRVAFARCNALADVTVLGAYVRFGLKAFCECPSLRSVRVRRGTVDDAGLGWGVHVISHAFDVGVGDLIEVVGQPPCLKCDESAARAAAPM